MAGTENVFGQVGVAAFSAAAHAGTLRYERGAAEQAARMYEELAIKLEPIRVRLLQIAQEDGFGGFASGRALQKGFSTKASDGAVVIDQAIEIALRMKESYLRAGGLIEAADEANRAIIARTAAAIENGGGNA